VTALYVLVFARGLAWEWSGILSASPADPPSVTVAAAPPARKALPALNAANAANAGNAGNAVPPQSSGGVALATAKVPLPPTDEPPPRDATDKFGVSYDAQGVAVMGIDADTAGVYNVPPGRQVRIGGPSGQLFDVNPGGKLTPATRVKDFPK
jgi:hypothetical protein